MPKLVVRRPARDERALIRRMMELYLHDFSEFDGEDLNAHGLFGYGDLDYFWFEPTHAAFLILVDDRLAGFALVDNEVVIERNQRSLTEFFILRKYRRQGIGRRAAARIFKQLPGRWEVRVIAANTPAQAFWRATIQRLTKGDFREAVFDSDDWKGPIFSFVTAKAQS